MKKTLGAVLKDLRKKKDLTAKNVSEKLDEMGYSVSDKTISGYETGIRMPNADVFMALCQIYDCRNILEMFSFVKAEYSIPTDDEWSAIEKYRDLDAHGRKMVDFTLNEEWERSTAEKAQQRKIIPMVLKEDINYVNAAHADDYANAPEELKQAEEEMIDKNFSGS